MATDPPASDLGAPRHRLEMTIQQAAMNCRCLEPRCTLRDVAACEVNDLRALLVAYDAQAARLAAQQPVVDAVLKLSTYSRETVDDGVRRIVQASDEYEEWLLAAGAVGRGRGRDRGLRRDRERGSAPGLARAAALLAARGAGRAGEERGPMSEPVFEITDRYDALGIPRPDPAIVCEGQCEGTGAVPIHADDPEEPWRGLWLVAEAAQPSDDGWHFVRCPDCDGTGRRRG